MGKTFFTLVRAIVAAAIGLLLVAYPANATKIIVALIGILFLLTGTVSLVFNIKAIRSVDTESGTAASPQFPVASIGCMLFGLALALMPQAFIAISMYILGALLVLGGALRMASFILDSKSAATPVAFHVVCVLVMLAGVFIFVNPINSASVPVLVLGVSFMVYGTMEAVYSVKSHMAAKRARKAGGRDAQQDARQQEEAGKEYITFDDDTADNADESAGGENRR